MPLARHAATRLEAVLEIGSQRGNKARHQVVHFESQPNVGCERPTMHDIMPYFTPRLVPRLHMYAVYEFSRANTNCWPPTI